MDVSSPSGHSDNSDIPKEPFSVQQYMKVDDVIYGNISQEIGKSDVENLIEMFQSIPMIVICWA